MTEVACDELPAAKPRYLMGVGTPEDVLACVARGVDMFDCVYPTRCARHALALTFAGRLNLRNASCATDFTPLDPHCECPTCTRFTRAYIAHCFRAGEWLGARLVSQHNLWMMMRLAEQARAAIVARRFDRWQKETAAGMTKG
jgi:queuine tRNA-ribosyltransferase